MDEILGDLGYFKEKYGSMKKNFLNVLGLLQKHQMCFAMG